jgi:hypothetical protein
MIVSARKSFDDLKPVHLRMDYKIYEAAGLVSENDRFRYTQYRQHNRIISEVVEDTQPLPFPKPDFTEERAALEKFRKKLFK